MIDFFIFPNLFGDSEGLFPGFELKKNILPLNTIYSLKWTVKS